MGRTRVRCTTEMSETVERWKGKDRVSKELRLLEPKNTSFRRSVASGLFTGEVRFWLLPSLMMREGYDISLLPAAITSKMCDGRSWRGEGKGFPGEVGVHLPRPNERLQDLNPRWHG